MVNERTVLRLREYLDAVTRVVLHVEEMERCESHDELEYLEGTLIELLERHRDVCKPLLDEKEWEGRKKG